MSETRMKVALLSGGTSEEREISIKSADQVARALDSDKYEIRRYDPAFDLGKIMRDAHELDVALIILHGRMGEDGAVQGFLDLLGIPYQGSGVLPSAMCMDKRLSKNIYRSSGLSVPRDIIVDREHPVSSRDIVDKLGLPVVVKPASEGSSVGMSIPHTIEDLDDGIRSALELDRWLLIEEYIEGRELTVSVLGNDELEVLPVIEIRPGQDYKFFNYEAKYKPGATEEICPAPISAEMTRRAQDAGRIAHQSLFCRGYSRTDMIMRNGEIYVLETNTIPGMTETSLFPQSARAGGYSFSRLMDKLIELALEDKARSGIRKTK